MRVLVLGRFQPLHRGHLMMLEHAAEGTSRLIVGIGSSNRGGTLENPFNAKERELMITESLRIPIPYEFTRIPDFNDNDRWIKWITDNIKFDVYMTNSLNEKVIFEKAGFVVAELPFYNRPEYWATEVRRRIIDGGDWVSLLPEGTIKVLEEIDGIGRIRRLNGKTN